MQKTCASCSQSFSVDDADIAFLDKLSPIIAGEKQSLPPPTRCPDCRQRRRLSFRNEHHLYRRTCDLTGASIISAYSPDKPFKVYEPSAWWGDQWDGLSYGRPFDFNRPFFEQFAELQREVPRISLHVVSVENADYVNLSGYLKDCYLLFAAEYDDHCLYGTQVIKSEHCVDTLQCIESAYCYEVVDCEKCHSLSYSRNCVNCNDSLFLADCRGCHDCILSTNLRNKSYVVRNVQKSKEEFEAEKTTILKALREGKLPEFWEEFEGIEKKSIHRALELQNCENVRGNYLTNSKNLKNCFDLAYAEDCTYVTTGFKNKDLMDVCHTTEAELGYEGMSLGYGAYGIIVTSGAWSTRDSMYTEIVNSCQNLFGCIALKNERYCILNKQYTQKEYEELVPKIIAHMQKTREWGEYFPESLSPFAYNETLAQDYYPLSKAEAEKCGFRWREIQDEMPDVKKSVPASQVPSDITAIPDDVLDWALVCEGTKRPFRIVKQELKFYRERGIPLPRLHPDERHRRRTLLRRQRLLHTGKCSKCGKAIETTFQPEQKVNVYCDECYLKEVY
ncbi:MAG: hypothetical protein Q7R81_05765 [Candidatus Peregrinibacteria bacterium]|nr:hypothetical protein [Candidatus Peregrinibacteria bacterium]